MDPIRKAALAIAVVLTAFGAFAGIAAAQSVPAADREALSDLWTGLWQSDTHEYEAAVRLTVQASGRIDGAITWTLRKSNRADYQDKIGKTGVEHVRGQFDPDTSLLTFNGYKLDDPEHILGMDQYRLVVGDNRKTMSGLTADHNTWSGRIFLRR